MSLLTAVASKPGLMLIPIPVGSLMSMLSSGIAVCRGFFSVTFTGRKLSFAAYPSAGHRAGADLPEWCALADGYAAIKCALYAAGVM